MTKEQIKEVLMDSVECVKNVVQHQKALLKEEARLQSNKEIIMNLPPEIVENMVEEAEIRGLLSEIAQLAVAAKKLEN
ncbi:MAG: hypothetical protein Q4G08_04095 [Capnocytophaga sp.]|nr:hypothetical protein [Capnocytophaga sp.]